MAQHNTKIFTTFVPSIALLTLYFGYNGLNNNLPELNISSLLMPAILIPIVAAIACSLFVWYTFDTAYKVYYEVIPHKQGDVMSGLGWLYGIALALSAILYIFGISPTLFSALNFHSPTLSYLAALIEPFILGYLLCLGIAFLQKKGIDRTKAIIINIMFTSFLWTAAILSIISYFISLTTQELIGITLYSMLSTVAFGWLFCTKSPSMAFSITLLAEMLTSRIYGIWQQ